MGAVASLNDVQSPTTALQLQVVSAEGVTSGPSIASTTSPGVTVSRTGTGAYRLTWAQDPGNFLGAVASLRAATPGNLAGHTVVLDEYDSTNLILDLVVYNAADAAHDLVADEHFTVMAAFSFSNLDLD